MWTGKEQKNSPDRRAEDRAADASPLHGAAPAQPRHVGILLRRAREAQNEELRVAAAHLRIRDGYLRAIEEGRFDELPSGAYAVGFVRAYAIHLGLDGDKLVRRFKDEVGGGIMRKPELVIPEPQAENRMPGGALVFASLLLAAGAYGGWYYVSGTGRLVETPVVEQPPVSAPARPAAIAQAPTAAPTAAPAPQQAAQQQAAPARAQTPPPMPLAATGGFDTSIAAPPRGSLPAPSAAPVQAPARAQAPPAIAPSSIATSAGRPQEQSARVATPDSDPDDTPAPEALKPAAKPPEPVVVQQALRQPAEQPLPRPPVSASAASAATIDGAVLPAPAKPRPQVVIRAIADSWLQVGDGRGPAIFAQVLRAGDSFTVPDRPGLRFDTGNAGGLEITVDGQTVPPLGPSGAVRRNIPLDADKLAAGAHH
jgi:cytoskeleton protein RodZ